MYNGKGKVKGNVRVKTRIKLKVKVEIKVKKRVKVRITVKVRLRENVRVKSKIKVKVKVEIKVKSKGSFFFTLQASSQDFSWRGAYLNNRDKILNFRMISHASSEDAGLLRGSGGMFPRKKFKISEILKLLEMH